MSTTQPLGPVYFEFPAFGFGPASTTVRLIDQLVDEFDCRLISTGVALRLAEAALPKLVTHDLNTFSEDGWHLVEQRIPAESLIVSNTNLPFASWAIDQGYRVGVVDTLDWMWDYFPDNLSHCLFYAAQYYFGPSSECQSGPRTKRPSITYTRPMINEARWRTKLPPVRPATAVIAFGGMEMPLQADLPIQYARWLLSGILPVLLNSNRVREVVVVGGHSKLGMVLEPMWANDPRIRLAGWLSPIEYCDLVCSSQFRLLTPGLATIYETRCAGLSAFFLPGFSMSQLLQSYHLRRVLECDHLAEWPESETICRELATLGEEKGVAAVASLIRCAVDEGHGAADFVAAALEEYLQDRSVYSHQHATSYDGLPSDLPSASHFVRDRICAALEAVEGHHVE